MMSARRLQPADLLSLERYHLEREDFRRRVMAHKTVRQVFLGPHVSLTFEDTLTIQYQVQEMLRIERVFESAGIQEELDAYGALLPEGDNWKATMMIEYEEAEERRVALEALVDVEQRVWLQVGTLPPLFGIADEDLDRSREGKTSAVHFLRFQLDAAQVTEAKAGAAIAMGIDHPAYHISIQTLPSAIRESLIGDLA